MKSHLSNSNLISVESLSFAFNGRKHLLNDVSLNVKSNGEIVCLLGPSGSGKSTLLRLIMGELIPSSGSIEITKNHLPIYQDYDRMIMPWFSVKKNILYGLKEFNKSNFDLVVSILEISDLLNFPSYQLSGGEKQRVVFARMLLRLPDLIIVDEPLSSIDISLSNRMIPRIKDFLKQYNISALWVTHNVIESLKIADSIVILNGKGDLKLTHNDSNKSITEKALFIQEIIL